MINEFELEWLDITWLITVYEYVDGYSFDYMIDEAFFTGTNIVVPINLFDHLTCDSKIDSVVLDKYLDINGKTL
jgi:hypothetical protein